MKLLFICGRIPDPNGSGLEKRLFSFLSAYSAYCDIDLWCGQATDQRKTPLTPPVQEFCKSITFFKMKNLLEPENAQYERLQKQAGCADVIHVTKSERLIPKLPRGRVFWDIDETPKNLNAKRGRRRILNHMNQKFRHFTGLQRNVEQVFVSSKLEQKILGKKTVVIPNSVILPDRPYDPAQNPKTPRFLFVGALGHYPNLHGIEHFVGNIWPSVLRDCPTARLQIVGYRPMKPGLRKRAEALELAANTEVAFNVSDIAPYYEKATAVISPIWLGAGTRVKIIEAFAYRRPVISSIKGSEGLEVTNKDHLLECEDDEAFAQACLTLARDPQSGVSLSQNAYEFYLKNHSQEVVTQLLSRALLESV